MTTRSFVLVAILGVAGIVLPFAARDVLPSWAAALGVFVLVIPAVVVMGRSGEPREMRPAGNRSRLQRVGIVLVNLGFISAVAGALLSMLILAACGALAVVTGGFLLIRGGGSTQTEPQAPSNAP
jgi:hypothetical protein